MAEALTIIKTAGASVNHATNGDGYVAIYDGATGANIDMALFYINHAAGNANVVDAEIQFIGVFVDFNNALTDGFVV